MVTCLNLSLSSKCAADCVFCPSDRGQRVSGYMSLEVVKKALMDCKDMPIREIQVGENGDALLNPNFIKILRTIKTSFPLTHINLTTNMFLCNLSISRILMSERLISGMQMNVDGHNAESYEAQKKISYKIVMNNLKAFLKTRENLWPDFPFSITVLTLSDYSKTIQRKFQAPPVKLNIIFESSFEQVKKSLEWTRCPIRKSPVFSWAERSLSKKENNKRFSCPQLPRIESEVFIAPNGDWYACCLDQNTNLVMGNIMTSSISEIEKSDKRKEFIELLKSRSFDIIGYPCNTVDCCQVIG